jgi:hypothetical protein
MKKRSLRCIATVVIGILLSSCSRGDRDNPIFETPEWKMNPKYEVGLRLRREAVQGGALLIKLDENLIVRRYDPKAKMLSTVDPTGWEHAKGVIANCEEQFPPDNSTFWIDPQTGQLRDKKGVVRTSGAGILNLTLGPQGDKIAILSAEGGKPVSLIPFWGSSGAAGQYWLQVWSLSRHDFVGQAVKIPRLHAQDSLRACWSADEEVVIFFEVTFSYFSVVTLNSLEKHDVKKE